MNKYLNMRFVDEFGKKVTMRLDNPKAGLEEAAVEGASRIIIDSGAFRNKGKLSSLVLAEEVTINTTTIVDKTV